MKRDVACQMSINVLAATRLEFQIAVAPHPDVEVTEQFDVEVDGASVQPREIIGSHGTRIHLLDVPNGLVKVDYKASLVGQTAPPEVTDEDLSRYLRPSRYAEADKLFRFVASEFGTDATDVELLTNIRSWVATRLRYLPGSSGPTDSAADTLLSLRGVCRDYTHLVIALLRAAKVPARMVAVYAPGCYPMDFHAVAEAYVDGQWRVVDATDLAPRSTLVRIATGRDAADTAFLDNHGGGIFMNYAWVQATVDGDLPIDDISELVSIG